MMTFSTVISILVIMLTVQGGPAASVVALVVGGRHQGRETQAVIMMETLESERSELGVTGFKQGGDTMGSEGEGTVGSGGESET